MSNVRPKWCPHTQTCRFVAGAQDVLCTGVLDKPTPHDTDFNTCRVCFFPEGEKEPYSLQFNKSDAWWIQRTMDAAIHAVEKEGKGR